MAIIQTYARRAVWSVGHNSADTLVARLKLIDPINTCAQDILSISP